MKTKKRRSFRFRLWTSFAVFTAFVFLMLWLLQTVFFQNFYDRMIIRNTKKVARAAAEDIEDCKSTAAIKEIIDRYAMNNDLIIFLLDKTGKEYLISADAFSQTMRPGRRNEDPKGQPGFQPGEDPELPPDDKLEPPPGGFQGKEMPGDDPSQAPGDWNRKGERRDFPEYGPFSECADLMITKTSGSDADIREGDFFIYGLDVSYCDPDVDACILVGATVGTSGPTVRVIRIQLIWATALSLLIGFAISWIWSRKFAGPVGRLSEKAKKLGEREYSAEYPQGFCSELDDLSDTLDRTNDKLIISKNFQTELMANVSHDLRTPLTMIKGYAEMITDISIDDPEQCKNDMQVIVKEADRLTALVNEILAYSELQTADKLEYSTQVDLSNLTTSVVESFNTLGRPDGITVESEIAADVAVDGSRSHLERVLYNLMENAVRHSGESKIIRVVLRREEDVAKLSVTDFGEGIPAEELAHIWDRYYTARQRGGKGVSGLGLAIVKQIVSLHGGKCEVSSEPGRGSTFTVSLRTVTTLSS